MLPGAAAGASRPRGVQAGDSRAATPTSTRTTSSTTPATPTPDRKTIAINLPNDEKVQLRKGTRRLQLKNAMRAKFDQILVPIADELIAADQRRHISFDAFFANVDVPRGGARPRHQEHDRRQGHGPGGAQGAGRRAGGGQGGHPRALHGHQAARAGRARGAPSGRLLRHLPGRHLPLGAVRRRDGARPGQRGRSSPSCSDRGAFTRDSASGPVPGGPAQDAHRRRFHAPSRSCASRATATMPA